MPLSPTPIGKDIQDLGCELPRISLLRLSKKSDQPQNERVEAYETEQRGLMSLGYDGDFCA